MFDEVVCPCDTNVVVDEFGEDCVWMHRDGQTILMDLETNIGFQEPERWSGTLNFTSDNAALSIK